MAVLHALSGERSRSARAVANRCVLFGVCTARLAHRVYMAGKSTRTSTNAGKALVVKPLVVKPLVVKALMVPAKLLLNDRSCTKTL
ncbi:hypothetical protein N7451_011410 [Penicillium sp. IBT 35674x]|nr:hypothetical protein N7451_011410 [Penicillium sp. IBT 35674x]